MAGHWPPLAEGSARFSSSLAKFLLKSQSLLVHVEITCKELRDNNCVEFAVERLDKLYNLGTPANQFTESAEFLQLVQKEERGGKNFHCTFF